MLLATTTTPAIILALNFITGSLVESMYPYVMVALGITVAFVLGRHIVSLVKYALGFGKAVSGQFEDTKKGSDMFEIKGDGRNETQSEIDKQFPLM